MRHFLSVFYDWFDVRSTFFLPHVNGIADDSYPPRPANDRWLMPGLYTERCCTLHCKIICVWGKTAKAKCVMHPITNALGEYWWTDAALDQRYSVSTAAPVRALCHVASLLVSVSFLEPTTIPATCVQAAQLNKKPAKYDASIKAMEFQFAWCKLTVQRKRWSAFNSSHLLA